MPMLGAQKCTWGPSYWCDSVENAKECGQGSEDHCRAKVWVGNHPLAHLTDPISEQDTLDSPKVSFSLIYFLCMIFCKNDFWIAIDLLSLGKNAQNVMRLLSFSYSSMDSGCV